MTGILTRLGAGNRHPTGTGGVDDIILNYSNRFAFFSIPIGNTPGKDIFNDVVADSYIGIDKNTNPFPISFYQVSINGGSGIPGDTNSNSAAAPGTL